MTVCAPERRLTDTIAAVATGAGPAGVGIVRIAGPEALSVADRLSPDARGARRQPGHSLRRVVVRDPDSGEAIDDGLRAVFHAPRSLTGEDVVELQGHGGPVTLQRVLAATLRAGARLARPGEFTERAFLNGKMDLAQAEAVAAMVSAQTVAAQRAARRQAAGHLSETIRTLSQTLQEALALVEASIDFPEEIGDADPAAVDAPLARAADTLERLLATAAYGRRLTEGITLVLAGRPNVGKSSLLNALAGAERAIVTPIAGTTRDVVEEALNLAGIPVRALDTAGIRDTADPVERIGVDRARAAIRDADVVIAVLDTTAGVTDEDAAFVRSFAGRRLVIAANKADAADATPILERCRTIAPEAPAVAISATTGAGLQELTTLVAAIVSGGQGDGASGGDAPLVTSARHEAAVRAALDAVATARRTLAAGLPIELVAVDAHGALRALGEITGETAREEIIAGIFARFCLGK